MSNYDIALQIKEKKLEIKNFKLYVDRVETTPTHGVLSVHETNELIDAFMVNFDKMSAGNINCLPFDKVVPELKDYMAAFDCLKSLKSISCTVRGWRGSSNTHEKFVAELCVKLNNLWKNLNIKRFSYPQKLILSFITTLDFEESVDQYNMSDKYISITDDDSFTDNLYKEVDSYDYSKYGVEKSVVTEEFLSNYEGHKINVNDFKYVIKQAGDSILIWSDRKIRNWLRKDKRSLNMWQVRNWFDMFKDNLKAKGIKTPEVKMSKREKILIKAEKKESLTQDELFSIFKQGGDTAAQDAVSYMTWDTLHKVISSDLRCVTKRWSQSRYGNSIPRHVLNKAMSLVTTKDQHEILWNFTVKYSYVGYISIEYVQNNYKLLDIQQAIDFGHHVNGCPKTDEFYNNTLKKIPFELHYNINENFTYEYMFRMSVGDKIKILPKVMTLLKCCYETLNDLYESVDYQKIRPILFEQTEIMRHMAGNIAKNSDDEAAIECLIKNSLNQNERVILFKILTFKQRVGVYLHKIMADKNDNSEYRNTPSFCEDIEDVFSLDEIPKFAEEIIKSGKNVSDYIVSCFEYISNKKGKAKELNAVIRNNEVKAFRMNDDVVHLLEHSTKKYLLSSGVNVKVSDGYSYWKEEKAYPVFYNTFTRDDINEIYKDLGIKAWPNRKYLAHVMTPEERNALSDEDNAFLRHNLEILRYNYLRKFENKKLFKECVGDRRNGRNKDFADKLLKKLDIPNSVAFLASLDPDSESAQAEQ